MGKPPSLLGGCQARVTVDLVRLIISGRLGAPGTSETEVSDSNESTDNCKGPFANFFSIYASINSYC